MIDFRSDEFFKQMTAEVRERVSKKRFEHIVSVSKTAEKLASVYECDEKLARLAGILHDWDKGLNNDEIRLKCKTYSLVEQVGEWTIDNMPQLLHGPTAAAELHKRFPDMPAEVINAIRVHTTADLEMSDMDMIIYVSDAIEPTRQYPELDELTDMVGNVELDRLYQVVYKYWTIKIIERDRILHPQTINIWNHLVQT